MVTSKPKQQLSLLGAIAIGLASMLGAGVFFVWSVAWDKSHEQIFIALLLAGAVASLNAASVYQLASNVSRAGGVYAYSRVYLPKSFSFVAGFSFVFGKIASIAAIAIIIETYLLPGSHLSEAIIVTMSILNIFGINRTALMAGILAVTTGLFLVFSVLSGLVYGLDNQAFTLHMIQPSLSLDTVSSASLIFFAFAGYARVATLGDEVRDPKRNIPRAIVISLAAVLAIYLLITVVLIGVINPGNEAMPAAVFEALLARTAPWVPPIAIDVVVLAASVGSILALLAGVSRTAATMAEDRELPKVFELRNRFGAPWLAECLIALGAIILIETQQYVQWVIAFSSFSVLLYYAIGHLSVLRQLKQEQKQPRVVAVIGLVMCLVLLLAVPGPALWVSSLILLVAWLIRTGLHRSLRGK